MRTKAVARFVRVPPAKARLVLDQVRGKRVSEALQILPYIPRAAARLVEKVLRSAIANAEHNHQVRTLDDLRIVEAIADGGPSMKRVQPRAMGRAFFIRHRTSHLTIVLSDEMVPRTAGGKVSASPSRTSGRRAPTGAPGGGARAGRKG